MKFFDCGRRWAAFKAGKPIWWRRVVVAGVGVLLSARQPLAVMTVGVATFLFVLVVKNYSFLGDEEMGVQDKAYQIRADTEASKIVPPFVMVDLTQRDLYQLNYPTVVPRNLLAKILTLAAAGNPKLIVVDVDLSWSGKPEEEAELRQTLRSLSGPGKPPIFLVRQLYGRGDGASSNLLKRTDYDEVVDPSPNLSWVSAQVVLDGDTVARRYLVAPCVSRGEQNLRLVGVQLASCAVLSEGMGGLARIKSAVASANTVCPDREAPLAVSCGAYPWTLGKAHATAEIAYRMRWDLPQGRARPQTTASGRGDLVEEAEILDAVDLAGNAAMVDPATQFGGRIVIIGTSAELLGDILNTSVGMMPGMFVMANGIRSAVEVGPTVKSGLGFNIMGAAVMSLVTYIIYVLVWRMHGVQLLLVKNVVAPLLSLIWLFIVSVALPAAHSMEFLYPQIIVMLYLEIINDLKELKGSRSQDGGRI